MTGDTSASTLERNRIPAIDRAMAVFAALERQPEGASIRDLVKVLGLPRTTVYRTVNSLELHSMVRRNSAGSYFLGSRLLTLAGCVTPQNTNADLQRIATPHLRDASAATGQSTKLSVVDGDNALVIATSTGVPGLSLSVAPGQKIPLHAGAAGKILMAHMEPETLERVLQQDLPSFTVQTVAAPDVLASELQTIRTQGWATDRGEYTPNIEAYAAPVTDHGGQVVAAFSIPFLSGLNEAQRNGIRTRTIVTAGAISAGLPTPRV